MYYTIEQLMSRLNRSKSFALTCIGRFNIQKTKIDGRIRYNISHEQWREIKEFNKIRQRH